MEHADSIFKKTKKKLWNALGIVGPGFVTGAADDDPSGIGTYSVAGAHYGLKMAWLIPFQLPLMFYIQEMCARIGLVTGRGLAANIKRFFPKPFLYFSVFVLVLANVINIGADIAIMSAATQMITGINVNLLALIIVVTVVATEVFVPYRIYSRVLMVFALFLLAYVGTAFMVANDWWAIIKQTFIPHIELDKEFLMVMAAFSGTTISPYLFFWQTSQEVEECGTQDCINPVKRKSILTRLRIDTFIGMLFSQLMAFCVVVTCYATLHQQGVTNIATASDAAMALKPLAGEWSSLIFTLGIIGSGFLGIPVLAGSAGYALSEIVGCKGSLAKTWKEAPFFYSIITLASLIGLVINFIGINPVKILVYAAVVNCIAAVPLLIAVILLSNNKNIMGEHKNGHVSNFVGWCTFGVMLSSTVLTLVFV